MVTAASLVRTRRRLAASEAAAHDETIALKAEVDRANALLRSEPQVLIAWAAVADEPEIIGDPAPITGADAADDLLAFGTWLEPDKAQAMQASVAALRAHGTGFATSLTTLAGWPIVSSTFILLPENPTDPKRSADVIKFFDWAYKNGDPIAVSDAIGSDPSFAAVRTAKMPPRLQPTTWTGRPPAWALATRIASGTTSLTQCSMPRLRSLNEM